MVLLDSTVLIDYLRGRPTADRVDALLDAGETLATTGVNVEEIVRGLRGKEQEPAQALFSGLFSAAVTAGARLATGNPKDFEHTPALVDHWPVGR